jgi:lipoyl(octanoyl) transferase
MPERRASGVERRASGDTDGTLPAAGGSSLDARRSTLDALYVVQLGRRPYAEVLELQRAVARARIAGDVPEDVLLLVEHPPVVTLGRSSKTAHLVASAELLAARGVELFEVERGGDVTFHGPGQLVGYPVVDLKRHKQDLHWYLRQVEEALIRALARHGVAGWRSAGYTGVWVGDEPDVVGGTRKIASIGVHARDWVTWHGFALNVATELAYFDLIVPCGIQGVTMTSLARELGPGAPSLDVVAADAAAEFGALFGLAVAELPVERLTELLGAAAPR